MRIDQLNSQTCLMPFSAKILIVPAIATVLGLLMIPWSAEIFQWTHHLLRKLPLDSVFATTVQAGSFTVIIGLGILITILDRPKAYLLFYLLFALICAGTANNVVKQLAGRSRPEWSVRMSHDKSAELHDYQKANPQYSIGLDKKDSWLGIRSNRPWFKDRYASFPSGHSCGVFVIAAFLSLLYPRARKFWLTVAVLCALARVFGARHYLEDVMIGGALGWGLSHWVFSWHWPMVVGQYLVAKFDKTRKYEGQPEPVVVVQSV